MKYLSVCSGIEAATVAWHPLGWEPVAFSEIEKFPSAVLAHHYPDVPNYGDMTNHERWPVTDIDVLVGGTPCQSFSVAGLRQGMADPRGNLALVYLAIAEQYRPRWLVWENVPGVLSSDGGRDFGSIVGGMVELGYSPCWRVLDAQYFGLAQRRRRVFIVASSRDWRDSAEVLLEPSCMLGHSAKSRKSREGITGDVTHSLRGSGFDASEDGTGRGTPLVAKSLRGNSGGIDREDMHTLIPEVVGALTAKGPEANGAPEVDANHYLPDIVGALSDGAHCGGGLNGQDAYSGRIIPVNLYPKQGQGAELQASETDVAASITSSTHKTERGTRVVSYNVHGGSKRKDRPDGGFYVEESEVAKPLDTAGVNPTANQGGTAIAFSHKDHGQDAGEDVAPTLRSMAGDTSNDAGGGSAAVAFAENVRGELRESGCTDSLKGTGGKPGQGYQAVRKGLSVRRLTPLECERLQGFPDGYTDIPGASDSGRYKALGNSMAVPVMRWIGERIDKVSRSR